MPLITFTTQIAIGSNLSPWHCYPIASQALRCCSGVVGMVAERGGLTWGGCGNKAR